MRGLGVFITLGWIGTVNLASAADWQPKTAPLMTRWAKDVTPDKVHPEYPRPQLVREHWLSLNGLWDYAIQAQDVAKPIAWDGKILVPFPVESALSGVMQRVGPEKRLWYRRTFAIPNGAAWKEKTIFLHFEAVDWDATVWVNGKEVAQHRGGFDPFSVDITQHLKAGDNELVVAVLDPSDAGYQPRGKQVQQPNGIWYTPVTGIWQTVWLEPVPKTYIRSLHVQTDIDSGNVSVTLDVQCPIESYTGLIRLKPPAGAGSSEVFVLTQVSEASPKSTFTLPIPSKLVQSTLWSPAAANLWSVSAYVRPNEKGSNPRREQLPWPDSVTGDFALRKISVGKDDKGVTRLMLNNQPLFQYGTLDQGWWPDGLYTAPTDDALKFDIEITKKYGFNLIRKHVKVEPARWYHWCDKLGMLVWQDMPNGDRGPRWDPNGRFNGEEVTRSDESASNYRREWKAIIDSRRHFPSIVSWVPFNEAWGQFDTAGVTKWTKEYDPTRVVNCASGGNDFPVGDIVDVHRYPGPYAPPTEDHRAAVLGEYGGLGLPLKGHTWQAEKNWGYRSFANQEALTEAYLELIDKLQPMIGENGLSAAIYTQTSDVEVEVNGLLTYDRAIEKLPVATLAEAHKKLWQPAAPVKITPVLPTAETVAAEWRFTTEKPADAWFKSDFDASSWKTGPAGFGEPSTPGSNVNTSWKSPDIWLRRTFDLKAVPMGELRLRIHHDEDAEVYLNGVLIKQMTGYTTEYSSTRLSSEAQKALQAGTNTLAVHCHQTGGGQYIDVGLEVRTPTR